MNQDENSVLNLSVHHDAASSQFGLPGMCDGHVLRFHGSRIAAGGRLDRSKTRRARTAGRSLGGAQRHGKGCVRLRRDPIGEAPAYCPSVAPRFCLDEASRRTYYDHMLIIGTSWRDLTSGAMSSPAPKAQEFRPAGVAPEDLRLVVLPLDGLEALQLADLVGLEQAEAARHMGVSRQTFGRILAAARRVASQALVGGLGLRIEANASVEIKSIATAPATDVPAHMKVAVSAHAASLEAAVAPRFGRAPGFLVVEPKTRNFEYVANDVDTDRAGGLGVDAAALIAKAGATVLLTGFVGAKALRALGEAGIRVADGLGALTAREAVDCFVRGEIMPISPGNAAAGGADAPLGEETG